MSLTNSTIREKIQTALEPHLQDIKAGHDGKITDAILTILIESLPEKKEVKFEKWLDGMADKPQSYKNNGFEVSRAKGFNQAIDQIKAELGK